MASEQVVQIRTPDGEMDAFLATPNGEGPFPSILLVHEAFGLNDHIKDVTRRLAKAGVQGLAPNLFYREPGAAAAYDNLPEALRLMGSLYDDKIVEDMAAAFAYLEGLPNARADRIGVMGFCMGGRVAFLTACLQPKIRAAVSLYGGGIGSVMNPSPHTPKAPLEYADKLQAPVLLLFGEDDPFIPQTEVEAIRQRLTELGKTGECVVYPGAQHGFFCDERASYHREAAEDAWERIGKFFQPHLVA